MIDRRALIGAAGMTGIGAMTGAAEQRRPIPSPAMPSRTVSVLDFGAAADGKTDDTAAFNRACQAGAPWSEELCYAIHVPSGRYRLDGTVYVRKGQTLFGDGHASYIDSRHARGPTFVLGRRAAGASGVPDPGGAPVRLSSLHAMGGSPNHGFVQTDAQGFSIAELFLTAVGIGIEITGGGETSASDGIIRDIFIDQCLQGILINHAQNLIFSSINIYRPRFAISVGSGSHDIAFSSILLSYTENVALTFSGDDIRNVVFSGSTFISNGQYEQFIANVLFRMGTGDVLFTGCTFRNWPRSALVQDKPGHIRIDFLGCVFDASQTSRDYDWSKSSSVLSSSSAGAFSFQGCIFRNLRGALVQLSKGQSRLRITGGLVEDCDEHRIVTAPGFAGDIGVRDVAGFAPLKVMPGQARTVLPLWANAGPWRVIIRLDEPDAYAEEALLHLQGDKVVRVGGWRSSGDRQTELTVVRTDTGPVLQVAIRTQYPGKATFQAETAC